MSVYLGTNLLAGTPDITGKANTSLNNLDSTGQAVIDGKVDLNAANLSTQGKSLISGLGMPSDVWEDLTVGASGTEYTATSNGYYAYRTSAQAYLVIKNSNSTVVNNEQMGTWLPITGSSGFVPVKKGQTVQLNYNTNSFVYFRFIYAEGEPNV